MLRRYRRHLALLAFGLLATPLVIGIVKPDSPESIFKEGRTLAPAPKAPGDGDDWLALPRETDAYLRDHFGLREVLIRAHKDVTRPLLGFGNDLVLIGRDGRMFYLGEETVRQSAGLLVRDQRVADAVDMLVRMNEELQRAGNSLPGRSAAQRGDNLSRRPASLGAKSGPADRVRPHSRESRGEGRPGRRSAAGSRESARRRSGLLHARYALDISGRAGRI